MGLQRVWHNWVAELNWGIEPVSSVLAGRFLSTGPPGKSCYVHFYRFYGNWGVFFFSRPPKTEVIFFLIFFYFIFKLYIIVLVLPNIKMNPPQVYMCSLSWTLLPPPSPYHPSESSQCTSPKYPVSCIERGLATRKLRFWLRTFPKVTHLVSGRLRIWIQADWIWSFQSLNVCSIFIGSFGFFFYD